MKNMVLVALTTAFVGALSWVACEPMQQGVAPGAVPSPETPLCGTIAALASDAGLACVDAETPARGSPAHRARLAERTRQDFDRRLERWTADGKSEAFIAYMRERGLEQRLRDIRTKPDEWFSIEAVRARIRALDERDRKMFLDAGLPPEQVEALVRSSSNNLRREVSNDP